jgi:diguanylate cyclase (GGDEF)-like protein/PAS domain S-box-containing protein
MNKENLLSQKWLILYLVLLSAVIGGGLFATGYLGDMARREIVKENEATITLLSTHLTDEFKRIEGAVKALSGSPWIVAALISGKDQDIANANTALDRYNSAMRASVSYLMDKTGKTIASSNRDDPDSFVGKSYRFHPYFTQAISGNRGRYFALGMTSLKRGFYASFPVWDCSGAIVGVIAMKTDLDDIEEKLSGQSHFFFINHHGVIFLSSIKGMLFKSLWPVGREAERALLASKQFGEIPFEAVFSQDIADGMDVTLKGKRYIVSRRVVDPEGWSVVFMNPAGRIFLYRSTGVILTLLICTLIIIPLIVNYKTIQSEEHFRTLFNEVLDGICLAEAETGIIKDCNQAMTALVCRERAELIGRPQTILHPPQDDKEAWSPAFKQHLTDKQEQIVETQIVTKTGDIREVEIKANFINLQGRKMLQGMFHDITNRKRAEEALRESEEKYKGLAEKSIAGVYVVQEGKFRFINSNAASYAGYTREELLEQEASILVHPEDSERVRQNARAMLLGEMSSPYEFRIITKQGETRWIMETVTSIFHEGRPAILGNSMNITERRCMEEALRENQSRLAGIVTFLPDATLAIDKEMRIIIWNKAIEEMTGVPAAEMIGKGDYAYTIPFYGEARPQLMDLVFLDRMEIASRYPNITREGDSLTAEAFCKALYNNKGAWVFAKASPLHDQFGKIIGAIESIRDITVQKQAEEKILQLAYHDSLTGLPNRKLFSDRLGMALTQAQRNQKGVAVAMIDLDNFKGVNDTLGHDRGDLLLKEAAERLSAALRKGDTVARFGGDEFVLILPDLKGTEDVIQVVQKIIKSFRKPFPIETHELLVTASIGIAVYPHDGIDEGILLKNADIAMYQAKQTGRDRYQICPNGAQ